MTHPADSPTELPDAIEVEPLALGPRQRAPSITVWGAATSRTMRVHWILHEVGLAYRCHLIGSRTGETQTRVFTALNARQKVPVIEIDGFVLAESAAIVGHLAERFGGAERLIPVAGSAERALYDQWAFFIAMELDAHTLYVLRKHQDLAALYGDAPAANAEARAGFGRQVCVAEAELARSGPYLLGEHFTGVDILLSSCLAWAVFYGIELPGVLDEYLARCQGRDGYLAAFDVNFNRRPEISPFRTAD